MAEPSPQPEVTGAIELITPERAAQFLSTMGVNRMPKKNSIAKYARDMEAGRWMLTGEPVIFDWNGQLRDGQNRMHAIIRAATPVQMMVVRGVDPASQVATNIGVPRRLSDVLTIATGHGHVSVVSAVTSRMYRWDVLGERASTLSGAPSYQEMVAYFREHEEEITSACAFEEKRQIKTLMMPSVYGTVRVLLWRIDRQAADAFLSQLTSGAIEDTEGPILLLRNRLASDRVQTIHQARQRQGAGQARDWPVSEVQRALIFMGWNHWRHGRRPGRLIVPRDLTRRYPVPE